MFPLQLFGSIGPEEENDADDVASVGNSLVDLGLDSARDAADTGAWDNRFDSAVKSFQEHNGLDVDGVLRPGGPTEAALNRSLELRPGVREVTTGQSERQFDVARSVSSENPAAAKKNNIAIAHHIFGSPRQQQYGGEGDADLPRISDRAARAIAEGATERGKAR